MLHLVSVKAVAFLVCFNLQSTIFLPISIDHLTTADQVSTSEFFSDDGDDEEDLIVDDMTLEENAQDSGSIRSSGRSQRQRQQEDLLDPEEKDEVCDWCCKPGEKKLLFSYNPFRAKKHHRAIF